MSAAKFTDQLRRFSLKAEVRTRGVFVGLAGAIQRSIKEGSPITGAPGQPVQTGTLRNSWVLALFPTHATVSTNVVYAPMIEAGMILAGTGQVTGETSQRLTLRSAVGGFHSVALTIAGANALQAAVVREMGP